MKITIIEVVLCSLPLDRPFSLGGTPVKARDYVALRIATEEGLQGFGIGYRSGTALFDALALLTPRLIGCDAGMRREINQRVEDASIQGRATSIRSLSLIDLALWDPAGKAAALPLYRLLGGLRRSVPAVPVAGFSYQDRSPEDLEQELQRLIDAGHRTIKIMIQGGDARANVTHVRSMAKLCRDRAGLIVDTQWSWRFLNDAVTVCRQIDDLGLHFIEDPFLPQQWGLAAELRKHINTPIAIGEDVLDIYGFLDLVRVVDVLRVDATASGGITTALAALDLAHAFGRRVLPHVFPYLHTQLACAHAAVSAVEYVPEETGTDPVRLLFRSFPAAVDGYFRVSEEPGIGVHLDWQAVLANAARRSITTG